MWRWFPHKINYFQQLEFDINHLNIKPFCSRRYKKDLMIKERKELAERNKKLKNKLKTLHQELESLKMEVNQILNVRSNQSKHQMLW